MGIHKGTELNNVNETWKQNEQANGGIAAGRNGSAGDASISKDLEQTIKEEAADYDRANKEERLLGGERASVKDGGGSSGE